MIALYLQDAGIWKKWGNQVGAEVQVKSTRNANLMIADGGAEAVLLSTIDVARLVVDDRLELSIFGKDSTSYEGLYARASRPETDPVKFRGSRLVHPGWNTRGTRIGQVILATLWGLNAGSDFSVVTSPWRIGPEKLLEKESDVSLNSMPFVLEHLRKKRLRRVGKSFAAAWAESRGNGRLLGGLFWTAWQTWVKQEPERVRALLAAWAEGMSFANRNTDVWTEKYLPMVRKGTTKEDTVFFAKWFREERPVYETPYLSAKDVEDENHFLKLAVAQKLVRKLPKETIWRIVRPQ
jgi:hypothetical protein